MKELKTLKDFETDWLASTTKGKVFTFARVALLRQEAIKWVKQHNIPPFGSFCEFFNITEEDLK